MKAFGVCGTLIHAPVCGEIEILKDAYLEVDDSGQIAVVLDSYSPDFESRKKRSKEKGQLVELTASQYLLPGLVDLHTHAPQWPQLGNVLHLPLEEWLQQYTFPLEAKYADIEFAEKVYTSLVDALIANGTTTAVYFATIHLNSCKLLADICLEKGQRALIGKVAMDNPDQCPDYYQDSSTQQGLDDTRALIEYISTMIGNGDNRVMPVVTPRFIPSCTDEMLIGLGDIAREYGCHVQTHCSESDWEHAYVIDRHGRRDTDSLDYFQLLTDKTVLAHANFLNDEDMDTIKSRQCGIAHCPLSNFYFSNAVFPTRKVLDMGIDVGLGTDIAGGTSPSLLRNCNMAVTASRALEEGVDPDFTSSRTMQAGNADRFQRSVLDGNHRRRADP